MGVLAVGALAVGVSVYAAPRADGTARGKTEASRLVTGASEHLQAVVDGGGVATGTAYVGIKNDYKGLDGSTQRLHFVFQLGGWGGAIETWQITTEAGLCGGKLVKPVVGCATTADCTAAMGTGSKCTAGVCDVAFQNGTSADFPHFGIMINACGQADLRCGSTIGAFEPGTPDDGRKWYGGDLILDVVGLRGNCQLCPRSDSASFLILEGNNEIPIKQFNCANIDVPLKKCCVLDPPSCTDSTTLAECNALGGLHLGGVCADGCIECTTPGAPAPIECGDGDPCTQDLCAVDQTCANPPIAGFNPATQCCKGGTIAAKADADPCTDDVCDGTGACANRPANSCGAPAHPFSALGTTCDDGNACRYDDVCDGAGLCEGLDANLVPCQDSADCLDATGGALECIDSFCFCTLSPALTVVIDPGDAVDPNCFDDGEKVMATIHVGASLDTIVGGEVAIVYDPACMTLNGGVITVAPFDQILFEQYAPGVVYAAVGSWTGGVANGNFDLMALSFTKKGGCAACDICFTDANPRHTRLTNSVGQVVTVQPECSKQIRGDGVLTLTTPPGGKYNTECDKPARDVNWATPTAADTCELTEFWCGGLWQNPYTGEIVDVGTIGVDPYTGGRFPIGAATFCCSAANDCGETQRGCWTVDINDRTSLEVDLQLSPTMAGQPGSDALTRCIKFEVFSNCSTAPIVFSETVSFGGLFELVGKSQSSVKIPTAGQFACITARDQLHTLRSCYTFGGDDCDANGVLHATFKGDPFFGGNWLIGGNLDGFKKGSATASLNAIDITDFGMFVSQFPAEYGTGNTDCNTAGPHADINGDGLVDMLDFTFISMNFLEDSKDCCCPGSAAEVAAPRGRLSVSVAELRASGMAEAAAADIDGNGFVNTDDITAFLNGQTPVKKGQARSRTGTLR